MKKILGSIPSTTRQTAEKSGRAEFGGLSLAKEMCQAGGSSTEKCSEAVGGQRLMWQDQFPLTHAAPQYRRLERTPQVWPHGCL